MEHSILAGCDRLTLDNGMSLRLLSAWEVLLARREARELALEERERPLCSNACLLARALEQEAGERVFDSGRAVLTGLRIEEIGALAKRWGEFNRAENPGLSIGEEELEQVKKN